MYAVIIARDITERKQIETRLMRNQRLENVGALAGGIVHDLNNVLSPIFLAVDILRSEIRSGEGHKMLETIRSSTQRGADLVRQILSFSRGVSPGSKEIVHLCNLVNEVVDLIRNTVPPEVEIYTSCPQRLPSVSGDTTQFHQVLINLCVNARDAMPKGGRLVISGEETVAVHPMHPEAGPSTYVLLTVADTGNGIPQDIQDKIFEPFFTTKEAGHGTGLGLSTVKEIVVAHGGFIDLTSKPKQGTVVRIYLPPSGKSYQDSPPAEDSYSELPEGRGEHVLLVDDEVAILEITRETLESFRYTVSTAKNGEEGLAVYHARAGEIDVVVTDMMMPVMDGYRMIQEIYAVNPRVRIICTSGLGKLNDIGPAEQAQICAVLQKPFSTEKLLRIIRKVIDEDQVALSPSQGTETSHSLQK
jgi:nitrogen-specific signal transduction histidine kinase/FixJ family two-component response regulator